jgi:hypothetical protein
VGDNNEAHFVIVLYCAKSNRTGVTVKTKGAFALTEPEVKKARALAAVGYAPRRIAREMSRSAHTITKVLRSPEAVAEVKALKKDLADLYEQRNYEILESVSKQDIAKANLRDKVVSAAICSDKMRLLREQSTNNINVQVLFEVLEAIRQRDQEHEYSNLPALPESCQ